jgi:spermidine synthase
LMLRGGAQDALIVGMGSGVTAGSALRHPVSSLDVVELVPAVAEAARHFAPYNHAAQDDPRLRLVLGDANAYLRATPRRYDAIINEPTNPWIAGVGNLFSADFYRAARARLKPGGVFAQWFHLYEMSDELVQVILRTFSASFPHVTLWRTPSNDIILIGSDAELAAEPRAFDAAFKDPALRKDLERIGVGKPALFLSLQAATDAGVRSMAGQGRLNDDRRPVLEYQAPKAFFLDRVATMISEKDERSRPIPGASLLLTRYLGLRGRPLSPAEFREILAFHRRG